MTNEEMCISIQNGDNTLKSQLWDNVSKIYNFLADKFFSNNAEKCTKCGLQRDDIHQISYFAFEHSIKAFDISKGYAFTTYAKFSLLAVIRSYFCKDTLNRCKSLDEIISFADDEQTIADLIADNDSSAPFEQIEDSSEREYKHKILQEEIDKLPEKEQAVINGKYYGGKTFQELSKDMNVIGVCVKQLHRSAIRHLRAKSNRIWRRLTEDLDYSSYKLYNGHDNVEYIATERAYLEELYKQYTEKTKSQEAVQCC